MATAAVDEEDNVLTCTVCLETYTDPCTLQCNHSFCRGCITDYVKTQVDAVQNKTIPCPFCRQMTTVPDPSRPVDEWAGQLHPGHVVQGLMASVDTTKEDIRCFLCQQLGQTTTGKFWCAECEVGYCQGCARTHSVIPSSRDHDLCDIKEKGKLGKQRKFKCHEHNEELKLYCKDCNKVHCQLCFVEHHRKCENVVTINSFISEMKVELSDREQLFEEQERESQSVINKKKDRVSQLYSDKSSAIKEIRQACQTAIDRINKKEKHLMDQVEQIIDKGTEELRSDVKVLDIQLQTCRQYRQYIRQAVSSDSEMEVCEVYQVWKSGQLDIYQEVDKRMRRSVVFTQDSNIIEATNSLHIGYVVTTYMQLDTNSSPLHNKIVDIRFDNDKEAPGLCHMTLLEVEGVQIVVVTDYNNSCIKSFYTNNKGTHQCSLPMNSPPKGITHWRDEYVMVALPDSKEIATIAVTPVLFRRTQMSTSKTYVCLAVLTPTSLAAGGSDCVDILNMKGDVVKSIITQDDKKLFSEPHFMCVSNAGHILVSDWHKSAVICITSDGKILWESQMYHAYLLGGANLRGITTRGKYIFIAEQECRRVIKLSISGNYIAHILTSTEGINDIVQMCEACNCRRLDGYSFYTCSVSTKAFETPKTENGIRNPYSICVDKHGSLLLCDDGRILNLSKLPTLTEKYDAKE